jgi:hypothetical protein
MATLKTEVTERLSELSHPKKNFAQPGKIPISQFEFSCGRGSPIRELNKVKYKKPSKRLIELAVCKDLPHLVEIEQHLHSCGRMSPIRFVSKAARSAYPSERIVNLATPNHHSAKFIGDRQVQSVVTKAAKETTCTNRITELSAPKNHSNEHYFIDSRRPEQPITIIKKTSLEYEPSERILEMAKANGLPNEFVPPNLSFWEVKRSALKAKCPPRFEELAKPIIRASMEHVQFDSNAFVVSAAAKKARCTPRLESLATPIQR